MILITVRRRVDDFCLWRIGRSHARAIATRDTVWDWNPFVPLRIMRSDTVGVKKPTAHALIAIVHLVRVDDAFTASVASVPASVTA